MRWEIRVGHELAVFAADQIFDGLLTW